MNEKLNQTLEGLKKQIKENWRIILVAAIVLVISFTAFQGEKNAEQNNQPTPSPSAQAGQNQNNNSENTANTNNPANTDAKTPENTSIDSVPDQTGITQTAQKGDSMTTMARRAVKGYLNRNGKTLTSEQKIYAEDYVRKLTPAQKIKSNQTLTFNEDIIKTAIEKSEKLTEKQIKNLGKFVPLVKNL